MADVDYVPGVLEGIAITKQSGKWDKRAVVQKYERPQAYNLMHELIWNKRSGPIDEEFKESVIDQIYKFDSRIDAGMWWKIRRVQEVGRERRREKMIKKKEEAVKHRTFNIVKKKTKIRQTKARIEKERARLNMTAEEKVKLDVEASTLKPLRKAERRVGLIRGIFEHMDYQKQLPIDVRRKVNKVSANFGYVSPKHNKSPTKTFFGKDLRKLTHDDVDRPGTLLEGDDFDPLELLSPRERYLKNKAVVTIQSIFRGRRAREWVDNQAQRLFPLRAPVSQNFHAGGKRGRAIFLEKKKVLLQKSKSVLGEVEKTWEAKKERMLSGVEGEERKRALKEKLKLHKIQKRLDEEAKMLHKNLRFIAACAIQNFCKNIVHDRYPHLGPILEEKRKAEAAETMVAFRRNESRKESRRRREIRKRKAVGRFNVIPLIVRMQRTWREYLNVTHSKREIAKAYALLKRMREDRISGQEFFRKLKAQHWHEISLAVEFNLKKRQKTIDVAWTGWVDYTKDRLKRKAWLYHAVRKRKCAVLEGWFREVMEHKREVINRVRPNLFPPLLAEYMRFARDNDWVKFLTALSGLFTEFDEESQVRPLKYEEHSTMKVIGFKDFTELNEMLTYQIAQSKLRKKVVFYLGLKDPEAQLSFAFWHWLHKCSLFLWTKANEKNEENRFATRAEEVGILQRFLMQFLMKRNLNPPSFSEKFRMRSRAFLTWHEPEQLCTKCLAILPLLQITCERCGSSQKPRFMRDTHATIHTNLEHDGLLGDARGVTYQRGLRTGKRKENVVNGVEDIDEPLDLFIYHAMLCIITPVGSWRRANSTVEEAWMYGVRGGMQHVHSLKRRGVFTVGDLWGAFKEDEDVFDTLILDAKLKEKVKELLKMLDDVLYDALGESAVVEKDVFGDGESIAGSSWRRLAGSEYSVMGNSIKKKNSLFASKLEERIQMGR